MFNRFLSLAVSIVMLFSLTACGTHLLGPVDQPLQESVSPGVESEEPKPEILFRDIPWGCNPTIANDLMGGKMLLSKDVFVKGWDSAYDVVSAGSLLETGHALFGTYEGDVGGHSVSMVTMYFLYPMGEIIDRSVENSEFCLAQYQFDSMDVAAAYEDLKDKLTSLYGEGREDTDTVTHWTVSVSGDGYSGEYDTLERATTWTGGNDTMVVLMSSVLQDDVDVFTGDFLLLTYGKADVDQRAEDLTEIILAEMAQQERDHMDPQNTNGL